jgi:hypothetical protein
MERVFSVQLSLEEFCTVTAALRARHDQVVALAAIEHETAVAESLLQRAANLICIADKMREAPWVFKKAA